MDTVAYIDIWIQIYSKHARDVAAADGVALGAPGVEDAWRGVVRSYSDLRI